MNVLGTPSDRDVKEMSSNVQVNLPQIKGTGLKKKLNKCDPLLIDLLNKILVYSPRRRLKPFEALAHPYFDDLRASKLTINKREFTDLFNFNQTEIGKNGDLLQKLIPSWYRTN